MIFLDRSIPKPVAAALKQVRNDVYWLEDLFNHWEKDTTWLREAGAYEWLVVMRDKKVLTRAGERQTIVDNRAGCFILTQGSDPTKWEYLKLLASTLDRMEALNGLTARPYIFSVSREGKMRQVLPPV